MRLGVAMLVCDRPALSVNALQSVLKQSRLPDKVVVFDNSRKGVRITNAEGFPHIFFDGVEKGVEMVLTGAGNKNLSEGRFAVSQLVEDCEFVHMADDDMIYEYDFYEKGIRKMEKENVGIVGAGHYSLAEKPGQMLSVYKEESKKWDFVSGGTMIYRSGFAKGFWEKISKVTSGLADDRVFQYLMKREGYEVVKMNTHTLHMQNYTPTRYAGGEEMLKKIKEEICL